MIDAYEKTTGFSLLKCIAMRLGAEGTYHLPHRTIPFAFELKKALHRILAKGLGLGSLNRLTRHRMLPSALQRPSAQPRENDERIGHTLLCP